MRAPGRTARFPTNPSTVCGLLFRQRCLPDFSAAGHGRGMNDAYEVIVIGGGAAGLSGALMLARSRRGVLVVDAGHPRNAPADGVHGLLGREGMNPLDLLA